MDVRKLIEEGARLACCPKGCENAGKRLEDRAYWADLPCNSLIHRDEARAVIALTLKAAAEDIIKFRDGWPHDSASRKAYEVAIIHLRALAEQVEKANG